MKIDDATNLPLNCCSLCGKEVIGYVDNPEEKFVCEECTEAWVEKETQNDS